MSKNLKQSYFIGDSGSYFYLNDDNQIQQEEIKWMLYMHSFNHEEFEKILNGISDGSVGICAKGQYLCIDAEPGSVHKFKHISEMEFKRIIRDPDTIRFKHEMDNVILLQYNPDAICLAGGEV